MSSRALPKLGEQLHRLSIEILNSFTRASLAAARSLQRLGFTFKVATARIQGDKAVEVMICGLESKMYVRAAMDPAYATEEALTSLVFEIHRLPSLTPAERARVSASACRGWETRHTEPSGQSSLPAHRLYGDVRVQVA